MRGDGGRGGGGGEGRRLVTIVKHDKHLCQVIFQCQNIIYIIVSSEQLLVMIDMLSC